MLVHLNAGGGLGAWCGRPAVAGMLAGASGGLAFVLLSAALLAAMADSSLALAKSGPALPELLSHAGPRWLVRVFLGALLGAALGWGLGTRGAGALRGGAAGAAAVGAALGATWWLVQTMALAPFRPHVCALAGELGSGPLDTGAGGLACYLVYGVVTALALSTCRALAAPRREARATRSRAAGRRLEVYVASHCLSCAEAHRLTAAAAARFPQLEVRTIDVDAAPAGATTLPDGVVAVPTYLLDGSVVALGNPEPERLFALIASSPGPQRRENAHRA